MYWNNKSITFFILVNTISLFICYIGLKYRPTTFP
nr:MAG TPA: hypothetical protein [Caudoviricetes sp.]